MDKSGWSDTFIIKMYSSEKVCVYLKIVYAYRLQVYTRNYKNFFE